MTKKSKEKFLTRLYFYDTKNQLRKELYTLKTMHIHAYMHIPKVESGLSKPLLSNFQADNSCNRKQFEAEVKMELL